MSTLAASARTCRVLVVALGLVAAAVHAQSPLPTFAQLEAAGATIGEIRIVANDIFDTNDPKEDKLLFRWANALHIHTRADVIESGLLFKRGDPLSVRVLDETERLLRASPYLYDVRFRPLAWHDGVVDIEVSTRDSWSLEPGASFGRSGGSNSSSFGIEEHNLLGTGVAVGLGRSRTVDRSGSEFSVASDRMFGTRAALAYSHFRNSDGRRDEASLARPFYALDARWAAGASSSRDDRIDSIYIAGNIASQYRHREERAEVFGGWSQGLVDGWVQRWSLGVTLRDDAYEAEPGLIAPASLPDDEKLVAPFVRFELIEDRFEREQNRNLIGRPEFFALGLKAKAQLGWAAAGFGSTRDTLLYSGSISRGFEPSADHTLIASAMITGQFADGQVRRQRVGAQTQYYLRQDPRWLFYASASADLLTRPVIGDDLLLGGDNGLRGYPLRYQSGYRRALFTVEERRYTDLYLWQLFRIGGAAFIDIGRAWGGPNTNPLNPGWLADAGFGLRIVNTRTAFGNVLHVDLAFPLNATPDIKKVQFLVKTRVSF